MIYVNYWFHAHYYPYDTQSPDVYGENLTIYGQSSVLCKFMHNICVKYAQFDISQLDYCYVLWKIVKYILCTNQYGFRLYYHFAIASLLIAADNHNV